MGSYEYEMALVAKGEAERGKTARDYFAELDAGYSEEESFLSHRPDYSKTLFAPENDDIYREFCRYVDQPAPRFFDTLEDPLTIEGMTAADVYFAMKAREASPAPSEGVRSTS